MKGESGPESGSGCSRVGFGVRISEAQGHGACLVLHVLHKALARDRLSVPEAGLWVPVRVRVGAAIGVKGNREPGNRSWELEKGKENGIMRKA